MLSILGFIVTILLLVFVHEFGHYYVSKIFGVKVEEFGIGFGKSLWSRLDKDGVKWKISALPLGGYVKIYGYDVKESEQNTIQEVDRAFFAKPLYARALIVAAGPIANYLLAIVILTCFYFISGKVELPAVIGKVLEYSPAAKAGLVENDRILQINGKLVHNFYDLQKNILINTSQPVNLLIERQNELITITVTPELHSESSNYKVKRAKIGIIAKNEPIYITLGIFSSFIESIKDTIQISYMTLQAFGQMINGSRSLNEIGGPITIATESGKSLEQGAASFLLFIAMLSINLGILNLLPIPILDGGQLIFMLYEAIMGYPPKEYLKRISMWVGVWMIIFLVVISVSNDIKSLMF